MSDGGRAFGIFLADVCADGMPSEVDIMRSDNRRESYGGNLRKCAILYSAKVYMSKQPPV